VVVAGLGDPNVIVDGAKEVFSKASDDERRQLVQVVLSWVSRCNPLPLEEFLACAKSIVTGISESTGEGAVGNLLRDLTDTSLKLLGRLLRHANPATLLEFAATTVGTTLTALLQNVGQLPVLRHGILSNSVNAPTLELVWGQRAELVAWLVDVVECAKCFVPANGRPPPDPHALHVKYNELDISKPKNRHAIICQLQRLAMSVSAILRTSVHKDAALPETTMREEDTRLETDQIETSPNDLIRVALGSTTPWPKQHWLFVNGIGGEYHWLDLACQKLKERFGRATVGVFNRGDGLLWDLVECAGERSDRQQGNTTSQDNLIRRTASSRAAQKLLRENLRLMLSQAGPDSVVVAHSQGCLLLRLVLEDLVNNGDGETHKQMRSHLRVFTFGSPSIHWKVESRPGVALASYSKRTEHFANKTDFVAKLGVLSDETGGDSGYSNVFVNETWKGHLFGAQYSLDANHYTGGNGSWLLNCHGANQRVGPPAQGS
jgi:hypothetical protein